MTVTGPDGSIAHGGRLAEARRRFPRAPEPWVDLSTGINPAAYPLPELPAAAWTRLPEPEEEEGLRAAAAAAYGAASPALVAAAPGTQALIGLLPRLLPLPEVAVAGPTYAEHAVAWRAAGAVVRDMAATLDPGAARGAVVCNPNNPDGRRTAPAALLGLADRLASRGGLLVVDEAFADLEDDVSVVPALPRPGLVVLRSFGKTYGLAGLRLGFALAGPGLAATIRAALGPWAVSGPALRIGRRALGDAGWRTATTARLRADAARLDAMLGRAGLVVLGGTCLFRFAASEPGADVAGRLGRAGILVRAFAGHPGRLRFGLPGTEEAWARLERVLLPP